MIEQKQRPRYQRGADKVSRIPIKVEPTIGPMQRKPPWIKAKAPTSQRVRELKQLLREQHLHTVCEEPSCPNLGECFTHGTATFMIMGDLCTRRCPFCDVAHGRPDPLDADEPRHLAEAVRAMDLKYVVITPVDRDDLRDGGASHFAKCIAATRTHVPTIKIGIPVPDFRGRMEKALDELLVSPPDVFNHNLEAVPPLYTKVPPGSDYEWSLSLIKNFAEQSNEIPTKSGLMLGLAESIDEVKEVLIDMRRHSCDMRALGQYLQPSRAHLSVERFSTPEEFSELGDFARGLGFSNVASVPLVRSSYHADLQAPCAHVG
ncbi:MAG: lipoyl synthase [Proteobacteria bacterium]|nr:lipoyl synthase [Pseudomonadota bacterium]